MWVSGFVALAILLWLRARRFVPLALMCGAWILITLLPYSFLTYMPFVPSRHTYLPSAGVALLIAAALIALAGHSAQMRRASVALAIIFVCSQTAYVWTKKHRQYAERAQPTERLIEFIADVDEPVMLGDCFPYGKQVAVWAVRLRLNREAKIYREADGDRPKPDMVPFCQDPASR